MKKTTPERHGRRQDYEAQRHAVLRRHPGQPRWHHLRRLRQRLPNQIVTVVGDKGAVCVLNFPH
jgi:hypothetical protein